MTRSKDLTDSSETKAKYEELWNHIDTIDLKHANTGHEWQIREIELVLKKLDSFHTEENITKYEYETKRMAKTITICTNRIRNDLENADYLIINRFKDSIHKMWQHGFREDHTEHENKWNKDWYKDIEKLADEIGDKINRKAFHEASQKIGYKEYHSAEAYEKNELLRDMVLAEALKKHVGEDAEDIFSLMIHDIYANVAGCKFIGEDMQKIAEARELKLITELQFIRLMKLASEILPLYYYKGDNTWHRDSLEDQLRFETDYVTDYLSWIKDKDIQRTNGNTTTWTKGIEDEVKNKIACGRVLCNNRIDLTKSDLFKLEHGKKLEMKFCCAKCQKGERS